MIRKKIEFIKNINISKYLYFNFFCKNIIREGNGKILPFRNAVIDLEKTSKIYIGNQNLEIGTNKLKGSRAETYLRLRRNAIWRAEGGCTISYGSTIEILESAQLTTKFFTMNSFGTLIAGNYISIGEDVMFARNITVFDSDFHELTCNGVQHEQRGCVNISDHVWIGANVTILKNTTIGKGSIVAANTVLTSNVSSKENVLLGNKRSNDILLENMEWKR